MDKSIKQLSGFGNYFQTEAIQNALPLKQNSPQQAPLGLYAEQISGTAFTTPRYFNRKSWVYRLLPSVKHSAQFKPTSFANWISASGQSFKTSPTQLRLDALTTTQTLKTKQKCDFLDGITTVSVAGSVNAQHGGAIHQYQCNTDMQRYFYNSDAELLLIPVQKTLLVHTEFGILQVAPESIALIPRGIRFKVTRLETESNMVACGYLHENYGHPFVLPERGPIGANGLAEERHFIAPHAAFEDPKQIQGPFELIAKFNGQFWRTKTQTSPLNVVAWHGNLTPFLYNLNDFAPVWATNRDHSDPSIFTVLSSPSAIAGTANIDFVVFPPRWLTVENSFRPPYFHRNVMSECMGLIKGNYDGKSEGFQAGGISIHNCMSGHGPDATVFEQASKQTLEPTYYDDTLAFMLESNQIWHYSEYATKHQQTDYHQCWQNLVQQCD